MIKSSPHGRRSKRDVPRSECRRSGSGEDGSRHGASSSVQSWSSRAGHTSAHLASRWPVSDVLTRAANAVNQHVAELHEVWRGLSLGALNLLVGGDHHDPRDGTHIPFALLLLKQASCCEHSGSGLAGAVCADVAKMTDQSWCLNASTARSSPTASRRSVPATNCQPVPKVHPPSVRNAYWQDGVSDDLAIRGLYHNKTSATFVVAVFSASPVPAPC